MNQVKKLAADSLGMPWPNLTVIVDVDLETAANRFSDQPDRMEAKPRKYHLKVREGFLMLADGREDFVIVDGTGDVGMVHERIKQVILETDF
jgi:dTMP kinase